MKRRIASILTIIVTLLFIENMILFFYDYFGQAPLPNKLLIAEKFIRSAIDFKPEPAEQWGYLLGTLALPFLCIGFYLLFSYILANYNGNLKIISVVSSNSLFVLLLILLYRGFIYKKNYFFLSSSFIQKPLITIIFGFVLVLLYFVNKLINSKLKIKTSQIYNFIFVIASLFIILLISVDQIYNERDIIDNWGHFFAYFDSIAQVFLGKTLLVNDMAQYGLYAYFFLPIFKIIGLNVLNFTILIGIFKGLIFLTVMLLLRSATKNSWIAFGGFATFAFFIRIHVPADYYKMSYFQYLPHRMLFPVIFIGLLWLYMKLEKQPYKGLLFFFITFFSSLSILWNMETGLVVFVAWLAFTAFHEFLQYNKCNFIKILKKIGYLYSVAIGTLIITLFLFCWYTFNRSGVWPDLTLLFKYQLLFSELGFYSLPFPKILHPWNAVVLIYALGIFFGVRFFLEYTQIIPNEITWSEENKKHATLVFILSILGLGIFSYYISRSHDMNLLMASWPSLLILTLFTDKLWQEYFHSDQPSKKITVMLKDLFYTPENYFKLVSLVILVFFLSSSILSIYFNFPKYSDMIYARLNNIQGGTPQWLQTQIKYINDNEEPNDQVFIYSFRAPLLYLYTKTPNPLPIPGLLELLEQEDYKNILRFLRKPPENVKIFFDPKFKMNSFKDAEINPKYYPRSLRLLSIGLGLQLFGAK